jgi:hypothetical protein
MTDKDAALIEGARVLFDAAAQLDPSTRSSERIERVSLVLAVALAQIAP